MPEDLGREQIDAKTRPQEIREALHRLLRLLAERVAQQLREKNDRHK